MNYKSFVDVLFILLLGTIVMLAHSVTVGAVDTDLLKLGGDGVSPVKPSEVEVVVIDHDDLRHRTERVADVETLVARLPDDAMVLLVVADEDVRHRRVLEVWAKLNEHGRETHLGAIPNDPGTPAEQR